MAMYANAMNIPQPYNHNIQLKIVEKYGTKI